MPRPTRLNGEINRLRILVSDLRKANGECGDRVVAALDRAIDAEAEADRLRAELAELRDRVQSVIERGPRFTDGPMESAADSVVEELRAVLLDKGER